MHTLRTTLALTSHATVITLAVLGSHAMEPHLESLLANLLKQTTNTKKLVATAACNAIETLLRNVTAQARHVALIESRGTEKNPAARVAVCTFLRVILEESMGSTWNAEALEKSGALDTIERGVKRGLTDASPTAREQSRAAWNLIKEGWPDRAER
jgi:CLIP-associating protein 1/2